MANLKVLDGDGSAKYIKKTGAGTDIDPFVEPLPTTAATEATLGSIKTAVELIDNTVSGTELQVDVVAALPVGDNAIGRVKLTDGTEVASVDASNRLEVAVGTSALPTGAATEASLSTVAGAVSGTEVQVDVVGALPAGDNNIGNVDLASAIPAGDNVIGQAKITDGTTMATVRNLAANDALNVAIVDDNGNQVISFGGGSGGIQYTEGDTDVTITGTVAMWEDTGDTLRAASATYPLPVSISGALAAGDNNIGNVDLASAIPAGNNNIGDVDVASVPAPLNVTGGGLEATALRVTIANDSTGVVSVDDNGGALTVDGSVSLAAAIPAGNNNIGDVDVASVPAPLNVIGGGVESAALRVTLANDSTGVLSVDDNGGALTVDGTVSVGSALPAGDNNIGNVDVASVPAPLDVVGTGTEATALRVTIATDSTGVLSVDDNGGALTVDGSVSIGSALPAGDNNIGNVDIASAIPAGDNNIGNVDLASAVPAGTNLIGSVAAGLKTDTIYDGTTGCTPTFLSVSVANSGDNTLVAADAAKKIRVLQYVYVVSGAVTVTWKRASTAMSGAMAIAANGGVGCTFCPVGLFETAANEALIMNLSGAVQVSGHLVYIKV